MVDIANILALSKLTSDTPDAVRKAATMMIVGGGKNPLISGIASANIVEEATKAAVETTSAKAATTLAEEAKTKAETEKAAAEAEKTKVAAEKAEVEKAKAEVDEQLTTLRSEVDTLRPLLDAVAAKALPAVEATPEKTVVDGYDRMVSALRDGTTPDTVITTLAKPAEATMEATESLDDIADVDTKVIAALTTASAAVKKAMGDQMSPQKRRQAALMVNKMLDLPVGEITKITSFADLKTAVSNNS